MPHFYFHLHNDMDVPDQEGLDFANLDAAKAAAAEQARELLGALAQEDGRIVLSHRIDIEDEQHTVVGTVYFRDVVTVEE